MYGLLLTLAILVSSLLGEKLAKEQNIDSEDYWGLLLKVIICGVLGARLHHVLSTPEVYLYNPQWVFYIHYGGLGLYGAILGGLLPILSYFKGKKRHSLLAFLDIAFVVLPLGQAIGRWGNYSNMELLGLPTNMPWGLFIPINKRPIAYLASDTFHPLFLYESVMTFVLFVAFWLLYGGKSGFRLHLPPGFFIATYAISYGTLRFFLEFLRIDKWLIYGINLNQVISAVLVIGGVFFLVKIKGETL